MSFIGFPRESAAYLYRLSFENTIENMAHNKAPYQQLLTAPLRCLYEDLQPLVLQISTSIDSTPRKCISSMYSDMRFSRDTPLKPYLYLRFREGERKKDVLGFYFDMGYEYYSYGLRIYHQTAAGMSRIREDILKQSTLYRDTLSSLYTDKTGLSLFRKPFAKDHYPTLGDSLEKEILNSRCFYIGREQPVDNGVFSSALVGQLAAAYRALRPLYHMFRKVL